MRLGIPSGMAIATQTKAIEDVALNLFLQVNDPCLQGVNSTRRSTSRLSTRTKSRCPSRSVQNSSRRSERLDQAYILNWRANNLPIGLAYERTSQKKNFWQQFANAKTKELLKEKTFAIPKREPLYTARCGPKLLRVRSSSVESLATDISLLSISSNGKEEEEEVKKKRKRKSKSKGTDTEVEKRPDTKQGLGWESFAKQKRGILDEMISKDAANLQGFVSGKILDRAQASDIMTEEERTMLMDCCYTTGLAGKEKSASTENLVSFYTRGLPEAAKKPESKEDSDTPSRPRTVLTPYKTGSTLSPRRVINQHQKESRAKSALPFLTISDSRANSPVAIERLRRFSKVSAMTGQKLGGSVFPSIDGRTYATKTNRKIQSTIYALNRMTGYGDPTSAVVSQADERHFTAADYGRSLRYPQSIRVAPSLARVIRDDVRNRVGRPRRKEIKTRDIKLFDMDGPTLGRSYRNLIIFDWLLNVERDGYEITTPPRIEDIEGERPRTRAFPTLIPGLVGQEESGFPESRERSSLSARLTPFVDIIYDGDSSENETN